MTTPPAAPPSRLPRRCDVLVAGGGPAGATAAIALARAGVDVVVVERARFPRFHVGESLLPRQLRTIEELGLAERLGAVTRQRKVGAEFAFGHEPDSLRFRFTEGLVAAESETFNVERAAFDDFLLAEARRAGAVVVEEAAVREILRLAEDDVAVRVESGGAGGGETAEVAARVLVDASGQSTLVGKHLGTRQPYPGHRKVAFFGHFRGVERLPGDEAGHPSIVMMADGWFWMIAIDPERTSVGLVMDADDARRVGRELGVPPSGMLAWAIPRCPFVARRTAGATFPDESHVGADFSYRCRPYAGPGWFLVGDAATFLDPIFSTGICLAMVGATEAAGAIRTILDGGDAERARRRYAAMVETVTGTFFRLVHRFYQPAFRDLMMEGEGPLAVHRALYSILAGHVFPRPAFRLRWRLALMEALTELQTRFALVPRRPRVYLYRPAEAAAAAGEPLRTAAEAGR
ncbi:MAG TPA: tryptophan 7-halogenase [Thermoanaerobaculia bacterium]